MEVTVNLDSFWVGFLAAWLTLFVVGTLMNLVNARKAVKASEKKTPAPVVRSKK